MSRQPRETTRSRPLRAALPWLVAGALAASASTATARDRNTDRVVRNLMTVIDNVKLEPKFITGRIDDRTRQTAENLLRDCDYALRRAEALAQIPAEDQGEPDVQDLVHKVEALRDYREKLATNLTSAKAASAALDARYRKFREEVRPFADALAVFPEASGSSQAAVNVGADRLSKTLKQLGQLDDLCKTSYADMELDDRLAFQLAIDPVAVCQTAAKRQELATNLVRVSVARDLKLWLGMIDDARKGLEGNDGFVAISGAVMEDMVFDRPKAKAAMLAKHKPMFDAINAAPPPDMLAELDTSLDALWSEIDRLAPTYTFPTKIHHDAATEAGGRKAVASAIPGAQAIQSGMLFASWDIAKNSLDIPTERYRTGAVLLKVRGARWCQLRQFTAHQSYMGGGRYAASTFTFSGLRLQQCK